jgi:hypothetical protein
MAGRPVSAVGLEPRAGLGRDDRRPDVGPEPLHRRFRGDRKRSTNRWARVVVGALAFCAGALSGVEPTADRVADALVAGALVAFAAAAGSTAQRWTWFVAAGPALAVSSGLGPAVAAGVALAVGLLSSGPGRRGPLAGSIVGGLCAAALLHAVDLGFQGSSALVAIVCLAPLVVSGYLGAGRAARRWVHAGAGVAAGMVAAVVVAYLVTVALARPRLESGVRRLEAGMTAARRGDDQAATGALLAAAGDFDDAEQALGGWWAAPADLVPVLGHNAEAARVVTSIAADLAGEGAEAASTADVDELAVRGGRLDLAEVTELQRPLDDVVARLETAATRLAGVDNPWLASPLSRRMDRLEGEITDARPDAELAADAVRLLPAMLGGGDRPTRWFVAFVTPSEARGRTGLIGNYAELVVADGRMEMTRFGRARDLEEARPPGGARTLSGPADYLARWGRFDPAGTWRNVTMSPDFPSVGRVVTELYPQSGGRVVDGVLAIDPSGLAALLELTGPIRVPGVAEPLTAGTAAEFLLVEQYSRLTDIDERLDRLELLAQATFDRLTTGDLPGPRRLADVLGDAVAQGHLHLYSPDGDRQDLFRRLGADGALPSPDEGDVLAVVNNNASGNKIDAFLRRDIRYEVDWRPTTGAVAATATVTLTNDAPRALLPDYVIGSPLPEDELSRGTNRTFLSIYSPWALAEARVDGEPAAIERQVERGLMAYSVFLDVPPGGGQRTVTLELQGHLAADDYRLAAATQPLATADDLHLGVTVDGRDVRGSEGMAVDGARATATTSLERETTHFGVTAEP